jgi:O-antigen/teichoic acid export membrane protein
MQDFFDYHFSDLKKIVFRNTSISIIGKIVNLFLAIFSSILIARYLGSQRLGQYASLYAYLVLFGCLTTFGMEQIIIRESAKRKDLIGRIFTTAMFISFSLSIVATVLALFISAIFNYANAIWFLLCIAAIDSLLLAPLRLPALVFHVYLKRWYMTGVCVAKQILWIIVVGVLILIQSELSGFIYGHLFCSILEILAIFLFARRFMLFEWHWSSSMIWKILKNSWSMALSVLGISIYSRIDQVMLHSLVGDQKLGYYAISVNIAEAFTVFATALMASMLPILSKISSERERFHNYIKTCYRYLMPFIFGICAIVTFGSHLIIVILYGKKYILSVPALSVLIWSEVSTFFAVIMSVILVAKGLQKFILITTIAGAAVNIVLNIIFIPRWSIIGAAWATVISYCLSGFILFFLFSDTREFAIAGLKICIIPFLVAISLIGIFRMIPGLPSLILVPIIYLCSLFIFKIWNKKDARELSRILFKTQA